jgi:formamidopyrimidine-DNA glycosylase
MPELPEVETVKSGLSKAVFGKTILRTDVNRPNLRFPFPKKFAARMSARQILNLRRRAKYILIDLDGDETLISHLGMSGRYVIEPPGENREVEPHTHVTFHVEDGLKIHYCDPRRFGMMDLWPTQRLEEHKLFAAMGIEPLGNQFDAVFLAGALKDKRTPVKTALLDQRIVVGLGNIYVCEALHKAGISPRRGAHTIGPTRAERLVPIIRDVLTEAIAAGGSTLKDYAQADGELGYFQHRFTVYGREGEPCLKQECSGQVSRIVQSGRSTFFCSSCQR